MTQMADADRKHKQEIAKHKQEIAAARETRAEQDRIVDTRPGLAGETYIPNTPWRRQDNSPRPVPELDFSGQPWRITGRGLHVGTHNGEDYCLEWLPTEDTPQAQHERGELSAEQLQRIEARRAPVAGRPTTGRGPGLLDTGGLEDDGRDVRERPASADVAPGSGEYDGVLGVGEAVPPLSRWASASPGDSQSDADIEAEL